MTVATPHLPRCLQVAAASDPARPRLTCYDDRSGERVELSTHTLANWVIKTANLLIEDTGVEPGARVSLHLPMHWLTAVWLIAADAVGAAIVDPVDPSGNRAAHVVVDTGWAVETFAVSLAPLAAPLGAALPTGLRDYCAEVRLMSDQPVAPLDAPTGLTDRARARVDAMGLAPGERLAWYPDSDRAPVADLIDSLVAPLMVDGSAVWCRHPDRAASRDRLTSEQVTAVGGRLPPGLLLPPQIRHLGPSTA